MPVLLAALILAAFGSAATISTAHAFGELRRDYCADRLERVDRALPPIPVGCAVAGCCSDCGDIADDTPIVLFVDIRGEVASGVELRLASSASASRPDLMVEGDAAKVAGNIVRVGRGGARIGGLPRARGRALSVLRAQILIDPSAEDMLTERLAAPVVASSGQVPDLGRIEITLKQVLAGHVVAQSTVRYRFRPCARGAPRSDRIVVENDRGRARAAVLLDGARGDGCVNDEGWQVDGAAYLGNLRAAGSCPSRAVVFVEDAAAQVVSILARPSAPVSATEDTTEGVLSGGHDDAVATGQSAASSPVEMHDDVTVRPNWSVGESALAARGSSVDESSEKASEERVRQRPRVFIPGQPDVAAHGWSDATGDRLQVVTDQPRRHLPIVVWGTHPGYRARARDEVAFADHLLNASRCGVAVAETALYLPLFGEDDDGNGNGSDSADKTLAALLTTAAEQDDCRGLDSLALEEDRFAPGRINAYYVQAPLTGWYCARLGIVVVGSLAQPSTLAHQLAHALSLGHVNGTEGAIDFDADREADFGSDNLMWGQATAHVGLSEGQCFRAAFDRRSALNRFGRHDGGLFYCPDAHADTDCPALALDVPEK